jgi:hypothetical protein
MTRPRKRHGYQKPGFFSNDFAKLRFGLEFVGRQNKGPCCLLGQGGLSSEAMMSIIALHGSGRRREF